MKSIQILFIVLLAFILVLPVNSQRRKSSNLQDVPVSITAFNKGELLFDLSESTNFNAGRYAVDGNKSYGYRGVRVRGDATYFIADGVGIGVNLDLDNTRQKHSESYSSKASGNYIGTSFLYSRPVASINPYIQPFVNVGQIKTTLENNNISTVSKDGYFAMGVKAGALLPLGNSNKTYISPHIGWQFSQRTDRDNDTNKSNTSGLFLGAGISVKLGFDDFDCDCGRALEDIGSRFTAGTNVLEYTTTFNLGRTNYNSEFYDDFNNETVITNNHSTDLDFNLSYRRAVSDRLFAGANIHTSFNNFKYEEDPERLDKAFNFSLIPIVEYHPFEGEKLINAFVESGIGMNFRKNTAEFNSVSTVTNITGLYFHLSTGYDFGVADGISLVPRFGYQIDHFKNEATGGNYNFGDFFFSISSRVNFR